MYEKLQKLLDDRHITAYKLGKDTGIPISTMTSWKKGECNPKADKLKKIADYFGVTIEYFLE